MLDDDSAPSYVTQPASAGVQVAAGDGWQPDQASAPVWRTAADEWSKAGMPAHGVAGVLANIREESNFNPTLRHPDQPSRPPSDEGHYAHGLYQEGAGEWDNYSRWLQKNYPGSQWQDPRLQSEFAAFNLKNNYPAVWQQMVNASSPEEAAAAYTRGYLKPAAQYQQSRIMSFYRNGVPTIDSYANSPPSAFSRTTTVPRLSGDAPSSPTTASYAGPDQDDTSNPLMQMGEKLLQPPKATPFPKLAMRLARGTTQAPPLPPDVAQRLAALIGRTT